MPHTILDPVPLDQLVTRRVMTFTDAIRTVKSILFTVIPFEEGIPFWGKEIRQGTELKNGARTTQVKIGIFQYNTTTNQVLFLQGSCETTCMKGRISLQIKRTGRFDSNFCQESYNAPMLAMAFSNDELQQRLSPEDFTYKEFRNGKPYFFKEGLFHVGHFQQGIWIEYAPEHSLGEQAIFRAYKGEISVKLMTDSNGEQFWSEFFHDPMGVRFIQHCNGIRMHVGFKNDKPLHEWFYLIQLQNNQLYSISLQAKTSQWTLVRQSPDVYAFCLDADGMEVDRAFAIRQFQKIEADLRAFQLVAVNEPNACLPQTVECEKGEAFLPVALSALALTEKESESLVKQLVLLIQFGKDEFGCLFQGNID
ncbi:MAG: hypothetical protein Q8R79_03895, partial [Legionellaceae bacterium]|nr:hypothetical protein [Legionellaceae bacterium]